MPVFHIHRRLKKESFSILFFLAFTSVSYFKSFSQNLQATYLRRFAPIVLKDGKPHHLEPINFRVNLFIRNNKVASFDEPLYLDLYPDGQIKYTPNGTNNSESRFLSLEKKQFLNTLDFDSLIYRSFYHNIPNELFGKAAPCDGRRDLFKLTPHFQPWIFLDETRNIQGIDCQHAKLYDKNNELIWDLWFAPGIIIPGCTFGLFNLPGLMVEGTQQGNASTYTLLSYDTEVSIPDEIFWPECFNGNFTFRATLKPYTITKTH